MSKPIQSRRRALASRFWGSSRKRAASRRRLGAESLESRVLLAGDLATPFQNPNVRTDVNNDGLVSVLDALIIINDMRSNGIRPLGSSSSGEGEPPPAFKARNSGPFIDVNGDNMLSALDALDVIKHLRGEGEAIAGDDPSPGAPDLANYFIEVNGGPVTLDVLNNDSGSNLLIQSVTNPNNGGSVVNNGTSISYNPAQGFEGTETFQYTVVDQSDGTTDTANVVMTVGKVVRFSVETFAADGVTPISQIEAGEDFVVRVFVEDLRDGVNNQPPNSELGVYAAYLDLLYDAAVADFLAPVQFGPNYNNPFLRDFGGPHPDGVINEVGSVQTDEAGDPLGPGRFVFYSANFVAQDPGASPVSFRFQTDPADLPGRDVLLYRPPTLVPLLDTSIEYGQSALFTVTPPVGAVADIFTINEDTVSDFNVLANDVRFNPSRPLQVVGLQSPGQTTATTAQGGTVTIIGTGAEGAPQVRYTPLLNFNGVDTFTYFVSDGVESDSAVVTINVTPVNDSPIANPDTFGPFTANGAPRILDPLANDSDPDGDPLQITGLGPQLLATITTPAGNTATIINNGQRVEYTPVNVGTGVDTFTYTISDGQGGTASATITVNLEAFDDIVGIDVVITDLNGVPITQVNVGQQFRVRVTVEDLRPDPPPPGVSELGIYSAYIDLLFPGALVDINSIALGPQYNNPDFGSTGTINDALGIVDEVGSPQTNLAGPPLGSGQFVLFTATVTATAAGTATFTADPADDIGNDVQTFDPPNVVDDADIRYGSATVTIVSPGPGTPVAVDDQYTLPAGQASLVITNRSQGVLGNDTDPGNDNTLVAELVSTANLQGTLQLNPNGTFTFTPNAGFSGATSFTYRAREGTLLSNVATVTIFVNTDPLPPSGGMGTVYVDRDGNGSFNPNSERRLGGVELILRNASGAEVARTKTAGDGTYTFGSLANGSYFLEQVQPAGMHDGLNEVISGGSISRQQSDVVPFSVVNGQVPVINFGEAGLRPEHLDVQDMFGSASTVGFNVATTNVGGQGETKWFSFLDGWSGFRSASVALSADLTLASITVVNASGQSSTITVPTTGDSRFRIQGPDNGTNGLFVVRYTGSPSTFTQNFMNAGGEGEPDSYSSAVDQIFADGGL